MTGNPYNLRKKVEIPVQIQLEDDSAFLNEFASQPILGQVSYCFKETKKRYDHPASQCMRNCPNVMFWGKFRWTPAVPWGSCGLPDLHYVHFCLYSLGSNY